LQKKRSFWGGSLVVGKRCGNREAEETVRGGRKKEVVGERDNMVGGFVSNEDKGAEWQRESLESDGGSGEKAKTGED